MVIPEPVAAEVHATGGEVVGCPLAIVNDPATDVDVVALVEATVVELVNLVLATEYGWYRTDIFEQHVVFGTQNNADLLKTKIHC